MTSERLLRVAFRPLFILCLCLVVPAAASAATIYVAVTGDDFTGDGSAGNPFRTIGRGLRDAFPGDTVSVGPGTYSEDVSLVQGVTVASQQGASATAIESAGAKGVVWAQGITTATVRGFTIARGAIGVWADQSGLLLASCIVRRNGIGIVIDAPGGQAVTVQDCVVMDNAEDSAAGLQVAAGTTNVTLRRCTVTGNESPDGALGVADGAGLVQVESCILWGNEGPGVCPGDEERIEFYGSDVQGLPPEFGALDEDPRFWDPSRGDYRLRYGSPCVNTGISGEDMGAYPAITVGPAGAEWTTIRDGCEAVSGSPGPDAAASVLVAPGTYAETFAPRPWTLVEGASAGAVVVDAGGLERCVTMADHGALSRLTLQGGSNLYGSGAFAAEDCTFHACIFQGNHSDTAGSQGGGLYIGEAGCRVVNCLFRGNRAHHGGALFLYSVSATVRNCTMVDNVGLTSSRGGIHVYLGTLTLVNSILWGNGDDVSYNAGTGTLSYSDIEDGDTGTGNLSLDPQFDDPAGAVYTLRRDSPCLDAGTDADAPPEDLRGAPRPYDGEGDGTAITDMGAYETVSLLYNPAFDTMDLYNWYTRVASSGTVDVVDYGAQRRALHSFRMNFMTGAATTSDQELALRSDGTGALSYRFAIASQGFDGDLDAYREFPVKVHLFYQDASGNACEAHRYYYIVGTSVDPDAEQVAAGTWHARSIDLTALSPAPALLTRVRLQSQGWGWEVYFDDLDLVTGGAGVPDTAPPAAGTIQIGDGSPYTNTTATTLAVTAGADATLTCEGVTQESPRGHTALAQEFIALSGGITGARVAVYEAADWVVSLRHQLDGADIASFTATSAVAKTVLEGSFVPPGVNTRPGTRLYLVLRRVDGAAFTDRYSDTDSYPSGRLFARTGTAWSPEDWEDMGFSVLQTAQRHEASNDGFATSAFDNYDGLFDPWTLSSGEGLKTVSVRSADLAGNLNPAAATATVTLDQTPPATSVTTPASDVTDYVDCYTPLDITGSATDALSHPALVELSLNGGSTWAPVVDTGTHYSTWAYRLGSVSPGVYAVTTRATDAAGNISTPVLQRTITLNAPPATVSWIHTTQADFEAGGHDGLDTASVPGSVSLAWGDYTSSTDFLGGQGHRGWSYRKLDFTQLPYHAGCCWSVDAMTGPWIGQSFQESGAGGDDGRRVWTAPAAGFAYNFTVTFRDRDPDGNGAVTRAGLLKNGETGSPLFTYDIVDGDFTPHTASPAAVLLGPGSILEVRMHDVAGTQWVLDSLSFRFMVSAATLLSPVLDSGTTGTPWNLVSWTPASQPANTALAVSVRASDTPFAPGDPSPSWTSVTNGQSAGLPSGRHVQYRAVFSGSVAGATPTLEQFALAAPDTGAPFAVFPLTVGKSGETALLSWPATSWSPALEAFHLYRGTSPTPFSGWEEIQTLGGTTFSATDTPPAGPAVYYYLVTAEDETCREGEQEEED